jgi:crossover junction endodeoxyribonuclease RusA
MIYVTLPWPDRRLSPNARVHWSKKARVSKRARKDAFILTCSAIQLNPLDMLGDTLPLHITFRPKDRRRRDEDNLIASMKPYLDGIAQALGVDDSRFRLSHDVEHGAASIPDGEVLVCIGGLPVCIADELVCIGDQDNG